MIKISKVIIELSGKKLELAIDEVVELRQQLDKLIERKTDFIPWNYPIPYITNNPPWRNPFWYPPQTISGTSTSKSQPGKTEH